MSLELIKGLEHVVGDSGCVFDSLKPILSSCHVPEDLQERMWLSAQLSVCDFRTAGIMDFPRECEQKDQVSYCLQLLESKPTWWTTFTANFHHIGVICSEHRTTFEAQTLLQVYRNASELFETYQHDVELSLRQLNEQHQVMAQRSEDVAAWAKYGNEMQMFLDQLSVQAHNLSVWLAEVSDSTENVWNIVDGTETHLSRINNSIVSTAQILVDQLEQWDLIKQTSENVSSAMLETSLAVGELKVSAAGVSEHVGSLVVRVQEADTDFEEFQQKHSAALVNFQEAVDQSVTKISESLEVLAGPLQILAAFGGVLRNSIVVLMLLLLWLIYRCLCWLMPRPRARAPSMVTTKAEAGMPEFIDIAFY